MSAIFPDAATIRVALTAATRAPSVHNTQPWRWRVGDNGIHLEANRDLQLCNTDPDSRDLMISCGISLNHCVVGFAAVGWRAKVHRFPSPADTSHLAAIELEPHPATEIDSALSAAIPIRRTDRRHYSSRPVPNADIVLMGARAARSGVMLRKVEALTHLSSLVVQAAKQHAASYDYISELTTWSGRHHSHAGVPARNTPEYDPSAAMPTRVFAGPALHDPAETRPVRDNAVVLALGTRDDDDLARLRAGEATSLVLLTATARGLATCPITEPLEIAEIREQVRADVFGASGFPQMLLRIGWPLDNVVPLPPTPRHALSQVVAWSDGTPFE